MYYYINAIWTKSLMCQFLSILVHASMMNSSISHMLLACNTWLLVKYPLRRKGLSNEQILYSFLLSWIGIVMILFGLISQKSLPIQCFLFIKSKQNNHTSTYMLYVFMQLFIFVNFALLFYFYSSIIVIIKSLMIKNISTSSERKENFTRLIRSSFHILIISTVITFTYYVKVTFMYMSNSEFDLLLIVLYTFISCLHSLMMHHQIIPKRKKHKKTNF